MRVNDQPTNKQSSENFLLNRTFFQSKTSPNFYCKSTCRYIGLVYCRRYTQIQCASNLLPLSSDFSLRPPTTRLLQSCSYVPFHNVCTRCPTIYLGRLRYQWVPWLAVPQRARSKSCRRASHSFSARISLSRCRVETAPAQEFMQTTHQICLSLSASSDDY